MISDIISEMKKPGEWDKINNRNAINDFFKLPAPDNIIKNAFIHDIKNDKPIDCNIYHPKYGVYPGFETVHDDVMAQGIEVQNEDGTKDAQAIFYPLRYSVNGKYVHCHYSQNILCEHWEYGEDEFVKEDEYRNVTNKDGIPVHLVDFTLSHQTRNVETESDFQLIYQREFDNAHLDNTPEAIEAFKKGLITKVEHLIQLHQINSDFNKNTDFNIIGLATRFKKYLAHGHYSHREIIFANKIKAQAGIEKEKTAEDWRKERGEKARQQFYTTGYSKNQKPITLEEAKNVKKIVAGCPEAEHIIINIIDNLENS